MPEFWMPHWCWWLHALWFDLEYGSEPETIFLWLSTGTQATCQEGRWWLNSDFGFLGSSLKGRERKLCSLCQGFLVSGATLQQCVLELHRSVAATVLVAQSCPTLCDPMDCSPPGSSIHWVGCHFLLQGNIPTRGLNPGLRHCGQTLYRLSHQVCGLFISSLVLDYNSTSSSARWFTKC